MFGFGKAAALRRETALDVQKRAQGELSSHLTKAYAYVFNMIAGYPPSQNYVVSPHYRALIVAKSNRDHYANVFFVDDGIDVWGADAKAVSSCYHDITRTFHTAFLNLLQHPLGKTLLGSMRHNTPKEVASAFVDYVLNIAIEKTLGQHKAYPGVIRVPYLREHTSTLYSDEIAAVADISGKLHLLKLYTQHFSSSYIRKDAFQEIKDTVITRAFSMIFDSFTTRYEEGSKAQKRLEKRCDKAVLAYRESVKKKEHALVGLEVELEKLLTNDSRLFEKLLNPERYQQFIEKTAFAVATCFTCEKGGSSLALKKDFKHMLEHHYRDNAMPLISPSRNLTKANTQPVR